MLHSFATLGLLPGNYKVLTELRLTGGGFIRFVASTVTGEYSDFVLFAMDLLENKASTVDLWGVDPECEEQPYVLEYCPEEKILYITFPGRFKRIVIYPLPDKEREALVRAFRLIAVKCLEYEGLAHRAPFF